jgi:ribosome-associated protein
MTTGPDIRVNSQIAIPRRELRFSFVRSSGPGGQNVNKVASKAVLRWSVRSTAAVNDEIRSRLVVRLGRRINDRGELVLTGQRFRDQARNVEDCLDKLRSLVAASVKLPKKRKKTRVPRGAKEERLKQKRAAGQKKQRRSRPSFDD